MATDLIDLAGHEQVAFCSDPDTGLRAIIALHDTSLGPGLGGTRFHPYTSTDQALADVLRLSRAMTSKNAVAGLDHGGGKAVIIGDLRRDKTPELLRAYGRFVESLGGRRIIKKKIGTYVADMDVVSETTRFATGRSEAHGGAGDSSVLTAYGVFQGMRAAAEHLWGTPSLAGRRVGISGVGKVGRRLVELLEADGASVVISDVSPDAVASVVAEHPSVEVAADRAGLIGLALDVFSPNAMGRALDDDTVDRLQAEIVCGAANNQLAVEGPGGTADRLAERGILYAPDFVVNSGGVIQVADELQGFDFERARARTARIYDTTLAVLRDAAAWGVTTSEAANRLAEERIDAATPGGVWLPAGR